MPHDDEYDQIEAEFMERNPGYAARMTENVDPQQMQLYPLTLAQQYPLAQVPAPTEPLLTRRVAGLPVWSWGVGVVGAAAAAYYYYTTTQKKVTPNTSTPALGSGDDDVSSSGGFRTSRGEFAGKLKSVLQKNGIAAQTTIYDDADAAKKKLKQVSPLVTMQCKGARVPLKELDRFAKREGLTAVEHDAGVVGFYPGVGKKGKAWEQYIDDLRNDGQEV